MDLSQLFAGLGKMKNQPSVPGGIGKTSNLNNSGVFQTGAGLVQSLDKKNAPSSVQGEATRQVLTSVGDSVMPGLGTAVNTIGSVTRNFTRNENGTYKNKLAMIGENMNVINLADNLITGDFSGKKKEKAFNLEKNRTAALKNYGNILQSAQNQANVYKNKNTFASYLAKGGKLSVDCGCNKSDDGIDTDVLNKFSIESMTFIQEVVGTKKDGQYKESDKVAMKRKAKESGKTLINYLNTIPSFKETLKNVESNQKGGLLFKGILKLKK